jgi:transcriptional regulator with GAF, ATPase, and Fis domain
MSTTIGDRSGVGQALSPDYKPEFDSLRNLLLEIAPERSVELLLSKVVRALGERPHAVLAQVWLVAEGDRCASCPRHEQCPDRSRCLHLISGEAGSLDTSHIRLPIGFGTIGGIAASGNPYVTNHISTELTEAVRITDKSICSFDGQPISFKGETLGVLAQYNRIPNPEQSPAWLRIFADHIGAAIANARAFEEIEKLKSHLELENTFLREEVQEAKAFGDMIGQSAALKQILRQVKLVARTDASVLILGESGTGKELVAREIHKLSQRSRRPLIRVNCASIPRELYESEFFGHFKGAFTGALKDRAGRFEAAHGGTLFLDEVGEIPPDLQSKFLRVLQEGQYERVGEERTRTVDVRIIAATNCDLPQAVASGRFRQDLYYRLNVFPIRVAPLRERMEDTPLLAAHFIENTARRLKLPPAQLTEAHIAQLKAYHWPGNIRELQNTIERALILAQNGALWFDLPTDRNAPFASADTPAGVVRRADSDVLTESEFRERERENVLAALKKTGWKIHGPGGTAELLGVKPTTLIARIKKLGLKRGAQNASA